MKEPHKVVILPGASKSYDEFYQKRHTLESSHVSSELDRFARCGEASAVKTLCNVFKNDLPKQEGILRLYVKHQNPYTCGLLAACLLEQEKRECLDWFSFALKEKPGENPFVLDPSLRLNSAQALILFCKEFEPKYRSQVLLKAWGLLMAWEQNDMKPSEDSRPFGTYSYLIEVAVSLKCKDLICGLFTHPSTKKDRQLWNLIWQNIEKTDMADIVVARTGFVPVVVDKSKKGERGAEESLQSQVSAYASRLQNHKESLKSVISGKLVYLLRDPNILKIPQSFQGFNQAEPTFEHLRLWAIHIVRDHRIKVTDVPERQFVLQDYAEHIDDETLANHVFNGLKDIFLLSDGPEVGGKEDHTPKEMRNVKVVEAQLKKGRPCMRLVTTVGVIVFFLRIWTLFW
ncbi:MAG: hypothetical protein K2Y18_05275 [Alphaproteobacteria bacterium]|nr:hypothetical protein [Alphaproteobacteria bacterium]